MNPTFLLREMVEQIAPTQASVLIQGESGTEQELMARKLHQAGPRRNAPFLVAACCTLQEGDLFGYETGLCAGAGGLIAAASGGTLFLGEIGKLNGAVQVHLLHVLNCGEYCPVGGTRRLQANVRFVAATNQNLQELVLAGKFHDDLLYRIATITLKLPLPAATRGASRKREADKNQNRSTPQYRP